MADLNFENFKDEFIFQASTSSGKGGQHVNKVSTRIILLFNVSQSKLLSHAQKAKIYDKLAGRINLEGVLKISVQSERSQYINKKLAIKKFFDLLREAFFENKKRLATKPSKSAILERLKQKKLKGELKKLRSKNVD